MPQSSAESPDAHGPRRLLACPQLVSSTTSLTWRHSYRGIEDVVESALGPNINTRLYHGRSPYSAVAKFKSCLPWISRSLEPLQNTRPAPYEILLLSLMLQPGISSHRGAHSSEFLVGALCSIRNHLASCVRRR